MVRHAYGCLLLSVWVSGIPAPKETQRLESHIPKTRLIGPYPSDADGWPRG
jgi:hypothetical protein